jgi:hypothetical protein
MRVQAPRGYPVFRVQGSGPALTLALTGFAFCILHFAFCISRWNRLRRATERGREGATEGKRVPSPSLRLSVPPSLLLSLSLTLLLNSGCASFELPGMNFEKYIPRLTGRTGEFRKPLRMAAFWTDTVRTAEGQPAMRGFGGRLMFFDREHGKPVKVAGTLVIYAFDESHADADNPRPDRKYVFTPDQFARHYSKSELGHSYSVWIPWDPVGGESKEIGLICRFTPVEGGAVVSDQIRQALPGQTPTAAPTTAAVNIQRFDTGATDTEGRTMLTTTIDLNGPADSRLPTALARARASLPPNLPEAIPTNPTATTNVIVPALEQKSANAGSTEATQTAAIDPRGARAAPGSLMARFGARPSRVPGAPFAPPDRSRGPWRPTHVIPPSAPPAPPPPTANLMQAAANSVVADPP